MLRDVPSYRNLIEISHSGLEAEKRLVAQLVAVHIEDFSADGVRIDVVARGVVPGQIMITVGGGAETHGAQLVEWMQRGGAPSGVDIYLHPCCLLRPMFFLLPREAGEAKRQLQWIATSREVPATAPGIPAIAAAQRRAPARR